MKIVDLTFRHVTMLYVNLLLIIYISSSVIYFYYTDSKIFEIRDDSNYIFSLISMESHQICCYFVRIIGD